MNYFPLKEFFRESYRFPGIKIFAGKDIKIDVPENIKGMNCDVAGHDKLDGRSPFEVRLGLALTLWESVIIPPVHLTLLHVN